MQGPTGAVEIAGEATGDLISDACPIEGCDDEAERVNCGWGEVQHGETTYRQSGRAR